MRRLFTLASIVAVLLTFVGGGSSVTAGADDDCPDILVVGMRGSGEPAEGDDGIGRTTVKFWQEFRPRVPTGRTVELWANPYPAVAAIGSYPWQVATDFDAVASQARLGRYRGSIAIGERLLRNELDERAGCANTRFVLTGYSQGGQVAADVYAELPPALADKVVGMALFGDPTFNSASRSAEGSYEPGRDGIIHKRAEFRVPGQVVSYCHRLDPVCQGMFDYNRTGVPVPLVNPGAHTNYMEVGDGPGLPTYPL